MSASERPSAPIRADSTVEMLTRLRSTTSLSTLSPLSDSLEAGAASPSAFVDFSHMDTKVAAAATTTATTTTTVLATAVSSVADNSSTTANTTAAAPSDSIANAENEEGEIDDTEEDKRNKSDQKESKNGAKRKWGETSTSVTTSTSTAATPGQVSAQILSHSLRIQSSTATAIATAALQQQAKRSRQDAPNINSAASSYPSSLSSSLPSSAAGSLYFNTPDSKTPSTSPMHPTVATSSSSSAPSSSSSSSSSASGLSEFRLESLFSDPMITPPIQQRRKYVGCSTIAEYDRLDKVGDGTFGEVHKARHRKTMEIVALKSIKVYSESEGFPITAVREIKILKYLSHPNIVTLLDMTVSSSSKYAREKQQIFMVFPYMDHDLAGLLDSPNVRFTESQIKCYMKQLLEGLEYLHKNKIIHRDLKGANILINNKGELKIADYGLARIIEEGSNKDMTNCVVTRWYRPPELLMGCVKYDYSVDLWGVGCIFGEMFTRTAILNGSSDFNQIELIAKLCGTPTPENMPSLHDLAFFKSFNMPIYPRRLAETMSHLDPRAVSLLDRFLTLDPPQRITASAALKDIYFHSEPLPAKPSDLPQYASSHELAARKRKEMQRNLKQPPPLAAPPQAQTYQMNTAGTSMPQQQLLSSSAIPYSQPVQPPPYQQSSNMRSQRPRTSQPPPYSKR